MNMYVEALLRTLLSIVVIFVLARLNGAKQVSQLTYYDYIVGISAGSISAAMCKWCFRIPMPRCIPIILCGERWLNHSKFVAKEK